MEDQNVYECGSYNNIILKSNHDANIHGFGIVKD